MRQLLSVTTEESLGTRIVHRGLKLCLESEISSDSRRSDSRRTSFSRWSERETDRKRGTERCGGKREKRRTERSGKRPHREFSL